MAQRVYYEKKKQQKSRKTYARSNHRQRRFFFFMTLLVGRLNENVKRFYFMTKMQDKFDKKFIFPSSFQDFCRSFFSPKETILNTKLCNSVRKTCTQPIVFE